jgi:site-specific recombinase XerD
LTISSAPSSLSRTKVFDMAIDEYVRDMWSQGRFNSESTERNYRLVLYAHAEDVDNRDPERTGRDDVKQTLRRWAHPNSQRKNRSILIAFYDWMVEEGRRPTRPVRRRARESDRLRRTAFRVMRSPGCSTRSRTSGSGG